MSFLRSVENWNSIDHPKIWSCVRVVLGISLVVKAAIFYANIAGLENAIVSHSIIHLPNILAITITYLVIAAHLIGGASIALGTYTRFWAFVQIPVLLGAVVFINLPNAHITTELLASVFTLLLLTAFMVIGSGPMSVDHLLGHTDKELMAEV